METKAEYQEHDLGEREGDLSHLRDQLTWLLPYWCSLIQSKNYRREAKVRVYVNFVKVEGGLCLAGVLKFYQIVAPDLVLGQF